jgi:hypothetical protein
MPRSEGYVRRGTKARQPDTYIKVAYNGELLDEWLSRTEFIQLVSRAAPMLPGLAPSILSGLLFASSLAHVGWQPHVLLPS